MKFLGLVVIAVVIQTIINLMKSAFPRLADRTGVIFAICSALGILCCIAFDGDVFASYGLESKVPYLGEVLSGICAGGGSSIIYDIVKGIKGETENIESLDRPDEEEAELHEEESVG